MRNKKLWRIVSVSLCVLCVIFIFSNSLDNGEESSAKSGLVVAVLQQVAEIFALYCGAFGVKRIYLCEAFEYVCYVLSEFFGYLLQAYCSRQYAAVKQYAEGYFASVANFFAYKIDCVQVEQYGA